MLTVVAPTGGGSYQVRVDTSGTVEVVGPDDTLQQAARKMKDLDIGPLPVCEGTRVVGLLTDRDITVRATAEGLDPKATPVRRVMSEEVVSCFEDQDVGEAAELMQRRQIRRVLVLSRENQLVGMVSLGDLATGAGPEGKPGDVLERVSDPSPKED